MTHSAPPGAVLDAAYATCRDLHRTHGHSYYLAARLLPPWKRRHVHALCGFTRYTDDVVDADGAAQNPPTGQKRARRLDARAGQFYAALDGEEPAEPILSALRHTIAVFGLPRADFDSFFASDVLAGRAVVPRRQRAVAVVRELARSA